MALAWNEAVDTGQWSHYSLAGDLFVYLVVIWREGLNLKPGRARDSFAGFGMVNGRRLGNRAPPVIFWTFSWIFEALLLMLMI